MLIDRFLWMVHAIELTMRPLKAIHTLENRHLSWCWIYVRFNPSVPYFCTFTAWIMGGNLGIL